MHGFDCLRVQRSHTIVSWHPCDVICRAVTAAANWPSAFITCLQNSFGYLTFFFTESASSVECRTLPSWKNFMKPKQSHLWYERKCSLLVCVHIMNSMCVCLCEKCVCVCVGAHALVYLCQWMSGVATGVAVTLRPSVNGWPVRDSTLWWISTLVGLLSIFSTPRVSSLSCLDFWRWETASTPLCPCSQLVPHVIVKV